MQSIAYDVYMYQATHLTQCPPEDAVVLNSYVNLKHNLGHVGDYYTYLEFSN